MHHTIPQLQSLDSRYPTERKLLLAPSVNFGRELLGALARKCGAWIGWEVATLGTIAEQLSVVRLAELRLRRGSDVAIADTLNAAFDEAIAAGEVADTLATLFWSAGTRAAIGDAILELRTASVSSRQLADATGTGVGSDAVRSVAAIMVRYEALLERRGLADSSTVFAAAQDAFSAQAPHVLDHSLLVATPGWTVRGAPRLLFERLVQHGLQILAPLELSHVSSPEGLVEQLAPRAEVSPEIGIIKSSAAMFYAGSPADEIREVVRRAISAGYGLDEVEIATTNRDEYGAIIEALCTQIGANLTSLDGLPLAATRVGRALEHWFRWIESDYAADHIRRALESGDWSRHKTTTVNNADLAAELRRSRVGWGMQATRRAQERLLTAQARGAVRRLPDETDETFATRTSRRHAVMAALAELLGFLTQAAPDNSSAAGAKSATRISVAELARRTETVLTLLEPRGPAEEATLQRLLERLRQVASVPGSPVPVPHALATLRQELADLRAWTATSNTARPRRATGGHLHLTNIESAGATSRPLLFLVGLDADRTAGPVLQSPLLPEALRNRLNERGAQLATIEHRRRERAWQVATAIASSQTTLTLSYAMQSGAEGRETAPSPALLHAARTFGDDATLGYDQLADMLGKPASAIPSIESSAIDARDVLLSNMAEGPLLLNAEQAAREIFPGLNRGLAAVSERELAEAGHYHGIVPAAGVLDPRRAGNPVSPGSLEMLAACSLRWFYHTALDARLPEEPAFDPMVWLNVLERGTALHRIYELSIGQGLHQLADANERRRKTSAMVKEVAAEMSLRVPVSSDVVRDREVAMLEREALLFVNSEHEEYKLRPWTVEALEFRFGDEQAATFPLDDATLVRVHGRVDRVDRLADGTLRLVDYKSGKSFELDTKRGSFDGGRKLQLAVYSPAISHHFAAAVSAAEYRFPTQRGEGAVARAEVELLDAAPRIVRSMLDDVAAGRFVPTIDKADCAYCQFATICRTSVGEFHTTNSPRAEWAEAHAAGSLHFAGVLSRKARLGGDT